MLISASSVVIMKILMVRIGCYKPHTNHIQHKNDEHDSKNQVWSARDVKQQQAQKTWVCCAFAPMLAVTCNAMVCWNVTKDYI